MAREEASIFLPAGFPRRSPCRGSNDVPPGGIGANRDVADCPEALAKPVPQKRVENRCSARQVAEKIVAARAIDQHAGAELLGLARNSLLEREQQRIGTWPEGAEGGGDKLRGSASASSCSERPKPLATSRANSRSSPSSDQVAKLMQSNRRPAVPRHQATIEEFESARKLESRLFAADLARQCDLAVSRSWSATILGSRIAWSRRTNAAGRQGDVSRSIHRSLIGRCSFRG